MSIRVQGAIVREQGITFAVVIVKREVISNPTDANNFIASCGSMFPGMPVVLAAQDHGGRFTYYGRDDISKFLASVSPDRIPWKEFEFAS